MEKPGISNRELRINGLSLMVCEAGALSSLWPDLNEFFVVLLDFLKSEENVPVYLAETFRSID